MKVMTKVMGRAGVRKKLQMLIVVLTFLTTLSEQRRILQRILATVENRVER